jgi:dTDP-4-dehydrorhamnose 3,5-epimerase
MKFRAAPLDGALRIELARIEDARGFFARSFCRREFQEAGVSFECVQCNVSENRRKGAVRGMHFQIAPRSEAKIVRCTRGAAYDVIVDLRPGSPTYLRWHGEELTAESHVALYVPEGLAHGFQTLEDDTEILYMMSESYSPEHARGVRWNDPRFDIRFPLPVSEISERDAGFPDYAP